jgi:hypothetical protein
MATAQLDRPVRLNVDFDALRERLQNNREWGADVLEQAGEYRWRVKIARIYSLGIFGSKAVTGGEGCLTACGAIGKHEFIAYRVERLETGVVQVSPLPYIEKRFKITLALGLALLFIVPVIFSPLLWKWYAARTLRNARIYLPAFCRYAQQVEAAAVLRPELADDRLAVEKWA